MNNAHEIFGFLGALVSVIGAIYSLSRAYAHTISKRADDGSRKIPQTVPLPSVAAGFGVLVEGMAKTGGQWDQDEDHPVNLSYRLLREERYDSVIMMSRFLDMSQLSYESRLMFLINLAQAYKWSCARREYEKILQMEIWRNADHDIYLLAHLVLRDEFMEAGNVMRGIPTEMLGKEAYIKWPLFREFRKSIWFHQAYDALFHESPPS